MRARGLVTLLLAGGAVAACSPKEVALAAMAWADGRPVVVLTPCEGGKVTGVSIFESAGARWELSSAAGVDAAEIPAFTTPAGWQATTGTLTALRDGVTYLAGGQITNRSYIAGVEFTLAAIRDLGPDQVLAGPGKKAATMTKAKYRKWAAGAC